MTALAPIPAAYARTLADLHRLAVYAVSPAQRLVNGEIILESSHGGFSTFEYDGRVARVVDDRLVPSTARAHPITTLRAAAEALGIEPDVGQQEQFDVPPHGDLDEPLRSTSRRQRSWPTGSSSRRHALEHLRAHAEPGDDATIVRHLARALRRRVDMGDADAGRRATYGGSPGDHHHAEPYLYASPWAGRIDPFFDDATFEGVSLTYAELLAAADPDDAAREFLEEGAPPPRGGDGRLEPPRPHLADAVVAEARGRSSSSSVNPARS